MFLENCHLWDANISHFIDLKSPNIMLFGYSTLKKIIIRPEKKFLFYCTIHFCIILQLGYSNIIELSEMKLLGITAILLFLLFFNCPLIL